MGRVVLNRLVKAGHDGAAAQQGGDEFARLRGVQVVGGLHQLDAAHGGAAGPPAEGIVEVGGRHPEHRSGVVVG